MQQTRQRGAAAHLARASTEGLDASMANTTDVRRCRKQKAECENNPKTGEVGRKVEVRFRMVELQPRLPLSVPDERLPFFNRQPREIGL